MNPPVSIIIPCYNAVRWISAAIESALGQAYSNIQVIVVNDGSTDESRCIIEHRYPQVTCISTPNRGPSAARNEGLRAAQGEWIQFLDADDLLHPDKVRVSLEVLGRHSGVEFVWAPHLNVPESFSITPPEAAPDSHVTLSRNALEATYAPWAAIFRASFLKRVGDWDERLRRWVDLEYHARIAAQCSLYAKLLEPLYFYRQHSGDRISNSNRSHANIDKALSSLALAEKALEESDIEPRLYKSYLWPFYLHLARSSAVNGDRNGFHKLISKAAELRGSRQFRVKCSVAVAASNVFGVNLTSAIIEGALRFKRA